MPPQGKPYRRFKARGSAKSAEGLEGLQQLTDGAGSAQRPEPKPEVDPWAPQPSRRWWSLRGIGAWGWAWRVGVLLVIGVITWGVMGFLAINGAVFFHLDPEPGVGEANPITHCGAKHFRIGAAGDFHRLISGSGPLTRPWKP